MTRATVVALILFITIAPRSHAEDGFVPLFEGQDISQWVKRGGDATYAVHDGVIVGTSVLSTPNTFFCTPDTYEDFELQLELEVESPLNSGIQIRSNCFDEPRTVRVTSADGKSKKVKIPAGRVHGYQVEIDPSDRAWSGGIYDEGRRGWLYPLKGDERTAARQAFHVGQWNSYRIRVEGDHIQTWVNGVPVADLHDDLTHSGFIALQVHGIGKDKSLEGKRVCWRNLRIKCL
jgi:3-keto-disaccharide hydrolase